tara:strand:+ start:14336 stop:16141 length:1806 start_codon:yes stop_codon:yes gene_type:complete
MKVTVVGAVGLELNIYSDLMQKAGARIKLLKSLDAGDVGIVFEDEDVIAFYSGSLERHVLDDLLEIARLKKLIVCEISDGTDVLTENTEELSEYEMQAATGLVDTTGFPEGEATFSQVPFIAVSCSLYAASATFAAWNFKRNTNKGVIIRASRFLTGVNALTTFLPSAILGSQPTRAGNQHIASSPWNTYPTKDGWVLICTSKDEQWERLRGIAKFGPFNSGKYSNQDSRIKHRVELDRNISKWTSKLSTSYCVNILNSISVPAGPILEFQGLRDEPNINLRQADFWAQSKNAASVLDKLELVNLYRRESLVYESNEKQDYDQEGQIFGDVDSLSCSKPLSGLRVIEIGQFTTAPLAGRHLASLGAEVIKIEPQGGEPARNWKPVIDGVSYYFTITNSGKKFKELNLRDSHDLRWLKDKIKNSHVVIENMRPGSLSKLGLSRDELSELNPDLILCSVSGFGAFSEYPGRGAFDTVIQGMSGIMGQTRSNGIPVKLGISIADILGAQVCLYALVSALCGDRRKGGVFIDVSMQDVSFYAALISKSNDLLESYNRLASDRPSVRSVADLAENKSFLEKHLSLLFNEKGRALKSVNLPYCISQL